MHHGAEAAERLALGVDRQLDRLVGEIGQRLEGVRHLAQQRADARRREPLLHGRGVEGIVLGEEVDAVPGNVGVGLGARLHRVEDGVEVAGERRGGQARGGHPGEELALEVLARLAGDVLAVHPAQLLHVEAGGARLAAVEGERLDHLLARHDLAVLAGRPAEQDEEVEERLGQIALLLELADERRAIALRIRLSLVVDDHRQVAIFGRRGAHRLEDLDVLERVLDVVVAADHVRDGHVDVVHHVGEVEDRRAVGADDDEVLHVLGLLLHVALDEVVEDEVAVLGHAEDEAFAGAALVLAVGEAARLEIGRDGQVAFGLGALVDGRLVIVQTQPRHAGEQRLDGLGGGALAIGVLHAQEELAIGVAGEEPVEDGGADIADVDVPRGAGCEADAD